MKLKSIISLSFLLFSINSYADETESWYSKSLNYLKSSVVSLGQRLNIFTASHEINKKKIAQVAIATAAVTAGSYKLGYVGYCHFYKKPALKRNLSNAQKQTDYLEARRKDANAGAELLGVTLDAVAESEGIKKAPVYAASDTDYFVRQTEANLGYKKNLEANPKTKQILDRLNEQNVYAHHIDIRYTEQAAMARYLAHQLKINAEK